MMIYSSDLGVLELDYNNVATLVLIFEHTISVVLQYLRSHKELLTLSLSCLYNIDSLFMLFMLHSRYIIDIYIRNKKFDFAL